MAGAEEGCEAGAAAELAEEGALACLDAASLAQTTQLQSSGAAGGAGATPPAPLRPDDEDAELEAAALALDQHSQLLRRDLLARLLDWKRRAGEQQAALEAAGSRAAAEIAELRSEQQAAKAQLEKQQEVQRRMGHALHRSALWRRHRTLASAAWRAWREHIQRQRRLQRQLQVGARYYGVGRLQRRVLAVWRAMTSKAMLAKAKAQAAAAAAAEQHLQEAAGAASQQTQRLAEVEAALAAALQARAELEQGMRRAFMRGVCALNLEAMALMKPGGAGAEPAASAAGAPVQEQAQAQQPAAAGTAAANSGASLDGAAADSGLTMQQQQLAALMMQSAGWPGAAIPSAEPAFTGAAAGWGSGAALQAGQQLAGAATGAPRGSMATMAMAASGWVPASSQPPASPPARISLAPAQPLRSVVLPPPGHTAGNSTAAGGLPARPGTANACSLPSTVPPHIATMLAGSGRHASRCASPRPTTATARAPATSALAAPVAAGGPPLQVSRRSLAGQQHGMAAGKRVSGVQAVVVRGAAAGVQAAQQGYER